MLAHFPPQPTPFVGRVQELTDIRMLLANSDCRLLTITGAGGSGKTRLAIESAQAAAASFPDGTVFVALQPLTSSDLLVPTIARSLGMSFVGTDDLHTHLLNYLHEKSLLLLLDNFEHLLEGTALISALFAQEGIKLLVTSREALNLQEEWLYPLKGMRTPPSIYSTSLEDYEAVQLFLYHARRMQPNFDLMQDHEAVIRICKVADGLPLAIELAASWLKGLAAGQIADEMQHNLDFLATTARNVEERHRSLRAAFDQSWKLLSEVERQTFARLSVFRGGFDREAGEQVTGAKLPLLVALVEKSLLQSQPSGRFSIHELLRQYSQEHLEQSGDTAVARALHSQYYADLISEREIDLKGRRQFESLDDMDTDFENIRVAWDWALQTQAHEIIHQMIEGLVWYGIIRSHQYDVNVLLQQALAQVTGDGSDYVQARIVVRQSNLLPHDLQPPVVVESLNSSLAVIQQNDDPTEIAICQALFALFLGGIAQSDFQRALQFARDSFSYFERMGDRFYLAVALHAFAWAYYYQGERQQAMQYAHRCAQLRREIGDRYGTARILLLVAAEAYSIPDYDKAERFNREVRDIWQELRSWNLVSFVNVNLAYLAIFRGDFEVARALLDEALALAREVGIRDQIAYALAISGVLASLEERYTQAWQLLSQAQEFAIFTSSIEALEWGLPLAACGLRDYETARSANLRAFQFARRLNAPGRYFWHLPAACVLLAHEGYTQRAAELLGFTFTHPASAPAWIERWALLTRLRADLEAALGTAAYQAAWQRGESFDLLTVVSDVLEWLGGRQAEASTSVNPILDDPLTPRELGVLRLLASGLTNPQIAERLVIGVGTVKTHTLNIYSKLGVSSRTQAILRAQELGLLV